MAHRDKPTTGTKDASRQKFVRKAIESASEYNLFLNRQRRLERSSYMDNQTDTLNYPVGLGRQNKTLTSTEKIGRFPVAVMPSQYQDWFIEYTPQELEFLPVDTVLKGPIMPIEKLPPVLTTPDVSDFDSDSSSCSSSDDDRSDSCSCCMDLNDDNPTKKPRLDNNENQTTMNGSDKHSIVEASN